MAMILVATGCGCRVFTASGEGPVELAGRSIVALAPEVGGAAVAVVGGYEIWRRTAGGQWSHIATSDILLGSILSVGGAIFGGAASEAAIIRVPIDGNAERLTSFDQTPGRKEWFANGPPLHVRSLTATADGADILAAVHVGGIPRSADQGQTWISTIPIAYDVHEVQAHPSRPDLVAAAAAVGLCLSHNGGRTWQVMSEGLPIKNSLAVAVLDDAVLFSIQDGPFAKRSQIWRWRIGDTWLKPVREGLPEWLEGKVDTAHLTAKGNRAALVDGGGNLWLSTAGCDGWERLATNLADAAGLLIL